MSGRKERASDFFEPTRNFFFVGFCFYEEKRHPFGYRFQAKLYYITPKGKQLLASKVERSRLFFVVLFIPSKFDQLIFNGKVNFVIINADVSRHNYFNELHRNLHSVFRIKF